ncbi:MAG TPA: VWA domain-containing protein, partial [Pyrinomonadaceae bacterium]|nr:VWA domain-containing protein [Pyrinomonadaceae bacterium]
GGGMAFRAQTRIDPTGLLPLIAAASLALACASAAARAHSGGGRTRATQQQQTQTPTPTPSESPTPGPSPSQTPSPTPTPEEDVERIESDATNVLLSATDGKRRFVTTLKADDVRLLEDGVPQQITYFQQETETPLSLVLLVDASASQEKVMSDERDAASAFVRSVLRPGKDTASVLSFTGITRIDRPPTGDASVLLSAISNLKVEYTEDSPLCKNADASESEQLRCRTGVWDAVAVSVQEVLSKTPETTRRAIILLSDGDDTSSRLRLYQAVEYAVRNNSVVYSIGIRDRDFKFGEMRKDFLRDVSEQTGGRAFFPRTPQDLAAAFSQIEQELRSQYLISYTSTNRTRDGSFRKVQIEITNPQLRKQKLRLIYRQGYYAKRAADAEG